MTTFIKELFIKPLNTLFMIIGMVVTITSILIGYSLFKVSYDFWNDSSIFKSNYYSYSINTKGISDINKFIKELNLDSSKYDYCTTDYIYDRNEKSINYVRGIGAIEDYSKIYPIKSGRFFDKSDIENLKKVALIGQAVKRYTYKKGQTEFINIFDSEYEVIGEIGRDTMSSYGPFILIPITAMPKDLTQNSDKNLNILVSKSCNEKFEEVLNNNKTLVENFNVRTLKQEPALVQTFHFEKYKLINLMFAIVISLISTITFCYFWIDSRKGNLSIKRVLGARVLDILKEIAGQLLVMLSVATFISVIIFNAVKYILFKINFFRQSFQVSIWFIILIVMTLLISIMSTFMLRNIFKFNIIEELKR